MTNLIRNALANVKSHKLRVFVAIIWIVIGITAVVAISSVGKGLEYKVEQSLNKVSNKNFTVEFQGDGTAMSPESEAFFRPFTLKDIEELSLIEGVSNVVDTQSLTDDGVLSNMLYSEIFYDKKSIHGDFTGVEFKDKKNYTISYGRDFAIEDMNRAVIILTFQQAGELFESAQDAVGKGVSIQGIVFEIIGVAEEKIPETEVTSGGFRDDLKSSFEAMESGEATMFEYPVLTGLIPKERMAPLVNLPLGYNSTEIYSITVQMSGKQAYEDVSERVVKKLSALHPDLKGTYEAISPAESDMTEFDTMKDNINKFINIITLISLFVGGIGIMNIMYVAVIERQREIGIRRAIGARPSSIMFQFLVESVFITVVGGIIGIGIGIIVSVVISGYLPFPAKINPSILVFALGSSIMTGIIFGVIPAFKASRLDPIKAITK